MRTDERMERIRMTEETGEPAALTNFAGWALGVLSGGRLDAYVRDLQMRAENEAAAGTTYAACGERKVCHG